MSDPITSDPLSSCGKGIGLPLFCIGTIFLILRSVSRILTRTFYRLEDSLFYIASLLSWLTWIGNWTNWGDDDVIDTAELKQGRYSLNSAGQIQTVATEVLTVVTIVTWKFYLLAMYCRFFQPTPARRSIFVVNGLIVMHAAVGIIGSLAQCVPITLLGKLAGGGGPRSPQCVSGSGYGAILYFPDLVSALAVLGLPLLHLKNKEWTVVRKVALGWMVTAGIAIIIFTMLGWANVAIRYESDPWWAITALSPFYVSFLYMLIGCYGELHALWSKEYRNRVRDSGTTSDFRLGSFRSSLHEYPLDRPYISSPLEARSFPSRQSSVGERFPKYVV